MTTEEPLTFTFHDIENLPGNLTAREVYLHLKHKDDQPPHPVATTIAAQALCSVMGRVATPETVNTLAQLLVKAHDRIAELEKMILDIQSGDLKFSQP